MKRIEKYFSKAFFLDTLYRLRPIIVFSLIFFTITLLGTPATLLMTMIRGGAMAGDQISLKPYEIFDLGGFTMLAVPAMTFVAFSIHYKRNTADFFEHLPYTRRAMALSSLAAIASVAVAVITVSLLVPSLALIPATASGLARYDYLSAIPLALASLISSLYTMCVCFLAVSVTGTVFRSVTVALSVVLVPRCMMLVATAMLEALSPTLVSGHSIPIFNNEYNLFTALFAGNNAVLKSPRAFIYTLVLSVLILLLALWLYNRRPSETATRPFTSRIPFDIVRCAVSVLLLMVSILLIMVAGLAILAVAIIIGVALAHLLWGYPKQSRLKTFKNGLISLGITVGITAIVALSIVVGSAVSNSYKPEKEEIEYISIARELSNGQGYINYADFVEICVSDIKITDDKVRELTANALSRGEPKNYFDYTPVPVKIKSGGRERYRMLYLTAEESTVLNGSYAALEDYKQLWLSVGEGAYNPYIYVYGEEMEREKTLEILEKYKSEVQALGFEAFYEAYFCEWSDYLICYSVDYEGEELIVNLPIFEQLPETLALTKKYAKEIAERRYTELIERLDEAITSSEIQYLSVEYYGNDDFYTAFFELSANNSGSAEIVNTVKSYISPDISYAKYGTIFISIYNDDTFDLGASGSFAVREGVPEEEIISFIKKYEN